MTAHRSRRPAPDEYNAHFAGYIAKVPDGDVIDALVGGVEIAAGLLVGVSEEEAERAYAPGKWTLKEVIQHVADSERIFCYRGLCIARGDATPFPGFDENAYAPASGANARDLESLLDELQAVRESTVTLYEGLPVEAWDRPGTASGNPLSVRATAWINAGHLLHHLDVIQERYLTA